MSRKILIVLTSYYIIDFFSTGLGFEQFDYIERYIYGVTILSDIGFNMVKNNLVMMN